MVPGASPQSPPRGSRLRGALALGAVALPGLAIVLADLLLRGASLRTMPLGGKLEYLAIVGITVLMWGGLCVAAAREDGAARWVARALLSFLAIFVLGSQYFFFARYGSFLNYRAVLVGSSFLPSIGQQLISDRGTIAIAVLPPLLVAFASPLVLRRLIRVTRPLSLGALDGALVCFMLLSFHILPRSLGELGAPPDALYLSSLGKLARASVSRDGTVPRLLPGPRHPAPLPVLVPRPSRPRNVVLIVTESVRADVVCPSYSDSCTTTPFTNEAARGRIGLTQMRAVASTTAVSLAVLWSGVSAAAPRSEFHSLPLIWDYGHAAGFETSYFSAQNMFFANAGLWLEGIPTDRRLTGTEIDPEATYEIGADDGELLRRAIASIEQWRQPFVSVVHLSNTHFPYKIDPSDAPFLPYEESVGVADGAPLKNRYRNSVYLQDKHVATFLTRLRESAVGARTVVVFVSDHGEQLRERGAVGHTYSVFDEEIRVPFWIDAPPGTLSPEEEATLRGLVDRPVTMLDVFPTVLDLMGLLDSDELGATLGRIEGRSLLRGGTPTSRPVVLTNCSELFQCASRNWGALVGLRKLHGIQATHGWMCFDLAEDPHELRPLPAGACEDLRAHAERDGRGTPF